MSVWCFVPSRDGGGVGTCPVEVAGERGVLLALSTPEGRCIQATLEPGHAMRLGAALARGGGGRGHVPSEEEVLAGVTTDEDEDVI